MLWCAHVTWPDEQVDNSTVYNALGMRYDLEVMLQCVMYRMYSLVPRLIFQMGLGTRLVDIMQHIMLWS